MTLLQELCPSPPNWSVDWKRIDAAFDWVKAMKGCRQSPVYHAEGDVWIHTKMVCEALASMKRWRELDSKARFEIFVACLMHDVGKPKCTREEDGRITSRGHSRLGCNMTRQILWRMGVPFVQRERICSMILHHQAPFFTLDKEDAQRRVITMSHKLNCRHLGLVTYADGKGRYCKNQQEILDNILLFDEYCQELDCWEQPFGFSSDHSRFLYFRRLDRDPYYQAFDDCRSTMTLLCGLPASGKSHWVTHHSQDLPIITLDDIRKQLGISPRDKQGKVIEAAREQAKIFLRKNQDFVWNATNISRELRQRSINLAANYNARIRILYFEETENILQERNNARDKPVPVEAIQRMLRRWEVPDQTEAHEIIYYTDGLQPGVQETGIVTS